MKKIEYKLKKTDTFGLTHNSRQDVRNLAKVCNDLIDTVNLLIDEVNYLKSDSQKKDVCEHGFSSSRNCMAKCGLTGCPYGL